MEAPELQRLRQRLSELENRNAELERELITDRALHEERVRQLERELERLRALATQLS